LAERYRVLLTTLPVVLPAAAPLGTRHAYHLFPVRVPATMRRHVYDTMHAARIGVQVHYVPIYRHPLYADLGVSRDEFPETERAYAGLLSLPLHPSLTEDEQDRVVEVLGSALATAAQAA